MCLFQIPRYLHAIQAAIKINLILPSFQAGGKANGAHYNRQTISSYSRLMNNPATAETWLTAFSKDFGGKVQGNNKTGQKGKNSIFDMTQDYIARIPKNQTVTYARVLVDFYPQKSNPHRICITARGNLINYPGSSPRVQQTSLHQN
jgi:hypothetical protein